MEEDPTIFKQRYLVVPRTLGFVLDGDEVLLIRRSMQRRIFPGKINGLGGHVEAGEDVRAAAEREIVEEAGIGVRDLWLAGVVNVDGNLGQAELLDSGQMPGVMLFVFTAAASSRAVKASVEGELLWVPLSEVSHLDWVDGDPRMLLSALEAREKGRPFFGFKDS